MRSILVLLAMLLVIPSLAACRVMSAVGESMPASSGYVDELHASQDAAINKVREDSNAAISVLRENVTEADQKIRADVAAADQAAAAEFQRAIAEGKSAGEAMAQAATLRADQAMVAAQNAREEAARQSAAAMNTAKDLVNAAVAGQEAAISTAKKNADKALEESGDTTPWYVQAIGAVAMILLGGGVAGRVSRGAARTAAQVATAAVQAYDAAPMEGQNGEKIDERAAISLLLKTAQNAGMKPV